MTVSAHGIRGRRSPSQSKYGLMTTLRGTNGAESSSLRSSGSAQRWPNTASSHAMSPSMALA